MNDNQNLTETEYEKLGHYFFLKKKDLNNSDKITQLIILMLENKDQIKKMMSISNINIKNIKQNYIKYFAK